MFTAPTGSALPTLAGLLERIHGVPDARMARHLGISLRTWHRYKASNNPPKVVLLALWVETDYWRMGVHAELQNEAAHYAASLRCANHRIEALHKQIETLENDRLADAELPANSPFYAVG